MIFSLKSTTVTCAIYWEYDLNNFKDTYFDIKLLTIL